ncbi:MAG: hypothetical protein J6R48_07050 [Muribaculaceae bacterium]|nr:hypothetical protein [Muribaculaceae bacterium]
MRTRLKQAMFAVLMLVGTTLNAVAFDIATIAQSDPLVITGSVGTQNTYYHSSAGSGYSSPFSSSIYANLNINVYGVAMPFSFYYNTDNVSFSYPQFSFNISPTYKGWTLHLGKRSMQFSNYVFNIPFNGVGLEYQRQGGKGGLRAGVFYGILKNAINYSPEDVSVATPAYRRTGWGIKLGYGTSKNYLDLYLFRAQDHQSSIDEYWWDRLTAQENIVVGVKGRWQIARPLALTANVATSIFSTDMNAQKVETEQTQKWDGIYDVRYSSLMRWAGDVNLTANFKPISFALTYKMVQPDYMSMGVSYMSNNYHSLGVAVNTRIWKLSLGGNFSAQSDNLSKEQLYTTKGFVYSANVSLPINQKLNITAGYNGYLQRQYDGVAVVNDTTRINRRMNSFTLTPNFNTATETLAHSVSLSGNFSENKDLSLISEGKSDVMTLAVGANYSLTVLPIETSFGLNYSYQNSNGYESKYSTSVYSLSASKALLKEKNLTLSAAISVVDNRMDESKNLSVGGNISAGYTIGGVHNFSLSASYNKYANTNFVAEGYARDNGYDLSCSFSYSYSFTAFSITRNKDKNATKKYEYYSDWSKTARREREMKAFQELKNDDAQRNNSINAPKL